MQWACTPQQLFELRKHVLPHASADDRSMISTKACITLSLILVCTCGAGCAHGGTSAAAHGCSKQKSHKARSHPMWPSSHRAGVLTTIFHTLVTCMVAWPEVGFLNHAPLSDPAAG